MPNGDQWLTVSTKVEDPTYFTRPFMTSSDSEAAERRGVESDTLLGNLTQSL